MWGRPCEIRGRLGCNAASIGYRWRIRKPYATVGVIALSWNRCQERNFVLVVMVTPLRSCATVHCLVRVGGASFLAAGAGADDQSQCACRDARRSGQQEAA